MKLPGGPPTLQALVVGVLAVALSPWGPLRELSLYLTPAGAALVGSAFLPAQGPLSKTTVLGAVGGLSLGAFGFHQFRRRPLHALAPAHEQLALVTGASSGIGWDIAKDLARRGYGVVLVARREHKLRELEAEIRATAAAELAAQRRRNASAEAPPGPVVHVLAADLSRPEEAQRLYDRVTKEEQLRVSMLVANAGVGHTEPFTDVSLDKVDEVVNLNVLALTKLCRLFGADMAARGAGRIMTVSSIAGAAPGPLVAVYSATKAYVTSLTLALQHELEPRGVGVTCLIPGATRTGFSHTSKAHRAMAFTLPGLSMPSDQVARQGVAGMLRGDVTVVPGLVNKCYLLGAALLPPKLLRKVTELAWSDLH